MFFNKKSQEPTYSQEIIDILRLIRSENVGPRTFYALVEYFGNATAALEQLDEMAKRGGRKKPIKKCSKAQVEKEITELNKIGARLVSYKCSHYPKLLTTLPDAPPILSYIGNSALFNRKTIAIVGARNASLNGMHFAKNLAHKLKEEGFIIASGLARGIDTAAHNASIEGSTIAVIAGGISHIYPPENAKLFEKIKESNLLVAELPIGSVPLGRHFPQRNRIISGLSLATCVIEASLKSGSLITAKFALEQNREVFALPGFPMDPRSQGCNRLIKDGAHLLESVSDVLDNLPSDTNFYFDEERQAFKNKTPIAKTVDHSLINDNTRSSILELLSNYPIEIKNIAEKTNLPLPVIYTILLELEIAGKVTRYPGNKIALKFEEL